MLYRENGQFKTSYTADAQIFPIAQDRWVILAIIALAAIAVPMIASTYLFKAILIPFLILSLAAIGVNVLVGYCGQISLGSGAFMAVGAYAAYNLMIRIDGIPLIVALLGGGFFATLVGIVFGVPSLRVRGLCGGDERPAAAGPRLGSARCPAGRSGRVGKMRDKAPERRCRARPCAASVLARRTGCASPPPSR